MERNAFLRLVILLTLSFVGGEITGKETGGTRATGNFEFIGSMRTLGKGRCGSSQETLYYRSMNSASWYDARQDCIDFLDGTLLQTETLKELGNITNFLNDGSSASAYWIGGQYDIINERFEWQNGGVPFSPNTPWYPGYPNTRTVVTKVEAFTVGGIRFRTQFQDTLRRYICEVQFGDLDKQAEPCHKDNDLVVIVDSSGSISQASHTAALEFTARLVTSWADNSNSRISVIAATYTYQFLIKLGAKLTAAEIRQRIYSSPYVGGVMASHNALRAAILEFQSNPTTSPRNLVFLTNGLSSNPQATVQFADLLKSLPVRGFSVGVVGIGGNIGSPFELMAIAGGDSTHMFNINREDNLLKFLEPLSRQLCD